MGVKLFFVTLWTWIIYPILMFIYEYILKPFYKYILKPAARAALAVAKFIGGVIKWIWDHTIGLLWRKVIKPTLQKIGRAIQRLLDAIYI
jgi:hypothetical protein